MSESIITLNADTADTGRVIFISNKFVVNYDLMKLIGQNYFQQTRISTSDETDFSSTIFTNLSTIYSAIISLIYGK